MIYKPNVNFTNRFDLPLNGPGNYRVRDNIIYTRAIEINAVRHCNLSCRSCSHSSPIVSKQELNPEQAAADLNMLSRFMKCQTVRVVGGEPLLHSNLAGLLNAVKASGISEHICIVTNGTLLHRIDDQILSLIDEIQISLYPLSSTLVTKIRDKAKEITCDRVKVQVLEYTSFRESISQFPTIDKALVKIIYDTCQIAHFWRCLTVDNGKIYRCPQSMVFSEKYNDYSTCLEIRKVWNVDTLLSFLENNQPCAACACCLGSIGVEFQHEQLHASAWTSKLPQYPEDALDHDYAGKLCVDAHSNNGCMRREWL